VSNILTDWRRALVDYLAENLQDGVFDVRGGTRTGVSRDKHRACVFVPRIRQDDGNINFARPPMIVRAWPPKPKQPSSTSPPDPEPLEQLAVDLMATLQPVQTTLLPSEPGFYFWVVDVEIDDDLDEWGVQATLTAWTRNPATLPS
jgi:hypothetical protein